MYKRQEFFFEYIVKLIICKYEYCIFIATLAYLWKMCIRDSYESLCGITQEEMERYFHEPISELAEKDECTYEEMKERLSTSLT